jgi:1-acyl-sn-glycerol-3-phosphate acyltransferase
MVLFSASLLGMVLFRVFNKLEVIGDPPGADTGPIIYYANHRHWLDPAVILFGCLLKPGKFLGGRAPKISTAARSKYLRPWYVHWMVKPGRVLEYLQHILDGLEVWVGNCDQVIKKGEQLLVFPERTENGWYRGSTYADLDDFGDLLAWLIRRNYNVQVVPVGIIGIETVWPKIFCRFGRRVRVVFDEPIPASVWAEANGQELKADLKLRLQEIIRAHQ